MYHCACQNYKEGAGETAQWVKNLLCKHQDLIPRKDQGMMIPVSNLSAGGMETHGAYGPAG